MDNSSIEILPSPHENDFDELVRKIGRVKNYVNYIHLDMADGSMSDHVSYHEPELFTGIAREINLEAHFVMNKPMKVLERFAKAGFKRLIAHLEASDPRDFTRETKALGVEVGIAIDGPSELDTIEPYLEEVDGVLVMMYKAGPSGQMPSPANIEKVRSIREAYPLLPITVDGGMNEQLAKIVIQAGATRLVATSFLFKQNPDNLEDAIERLRTS